MEKQAEKVGPVGAVKNFFMYYATFSGRSSRSEFWWLQLAALIAYAAAGFVASLASPPSGYTLFGANIPLAALGLINILLLAGLVVPSLAVMSRRLRDAGISPYFLFFIFLPFLGNLALLVMMLFPSKKPEVDSSLNQA